MKSESKILIGAAAFYFFFLRRKNTVLAPGFASWAEIERIHLASMGAPSDYPITLTTVFVQQLNDDRVMHAVNTLDPAVTWQVNSDGTISRVGSFE